jgi:hypothetical protein
VWLASSGCAPEANWIDDECYDAIRRRLGYRFELVSVEYTDEVAPGEDFKVTVAIKNMGWARLYKPRNAKVVLRDQAGNALPAYTPTNAEVRDWLPGQTTSLTVIASPPTAGSYTVHLHIPDPDEQPLAGETTDADYAIKLATLRGGSSAFNSSSGENDLGVTIDVQ